MKSLYDFIIVGSGASGSTLAYYLTKAGARCLLVEAGKEYNASTYPSNELDANTSLMWNGGMNANDDASLLFLRGKCIGGGTVINQALLDRFDEPAFDLWRNATDIDFFDAKQMQQHYKEVESHLNLHTFKANEMNGNAKVFANGMKKNKHAWKYLTRGQSRCDTHDGNDCIVCLGGCPRESKQSMNNTFLPSAKDNGLNIISEFEVKSIVHGSNMVTVAGIEGGVTGKKTQLFGKKCIVAAGSLGSTELMLRSGYGNTLPSLGKNFYCHPQMMNIGMFEEPVDAHKGTLQSVKSNDLNFREKRFKLENVFAGPIAIALLNPKYGITHQEYMHQYRHMACIEVAIRDVNPGAIKLANNGRLKISKTMGAEDLQSTQAGIDTVSNMMYSAGAKNMMSSPLTIGLHLMGGCAIGTSPGNSVVNEEFQVHGMNNLYIADSSIFPQATGINPSLSIMALAHKASEAILSHSGFNVTGYGLSETQSTKTKVNAIESTEVMA